jgi:hypothetical protein
MRRPTLTAVAVAISIVLLSADAFAAVAPTPVRTDPDRREFEGSGNADYFAWTQNQADAYFQLNVWVLPTGGEEYEVSAGGGQAFSGQMDHTGSLLPYSHCSQGACDLVLFDMSTKTKQPLPAGINTSTKNELFPALYGDQMTFLRDGRSADTLYLVTDLSTGAKFALKSIPDRRRASFASTEPRLTGNWVTYSACNRTTCNAFRYDIAGDSTIKVPNPLGKLYFAPSPDIAGNVYFEGCRSRCSRHASLMKWTGSGDPTSFYSLPSGTDAAQTSLYDDGGGNVLLYVDFRIFSTGNQDVYSFTNP